MSVLLRVAEYLAPVLKDSKFRQTGVITPGEFVAAGDHLVFQCPTWHWSSGEKSKIKSYLPEDKQFLVTKHVPCYKRYKDVESLKFEENIIDEEDPEGGWVETHLNDTKDLDEVNLSKDDSFTLENANKPIVAQDANDDSDSEAEDIENFKLDDEDDECVVDVTKMTSELNVKETNEIVQTRRYDLYITYDKYYQTPRLWLMGYDEHNNPLVIEKMYEDISQDHAKKTVTMEWHPHIPATMASIHPCRHAEMMKKILKTMEENGKELEVHNYIIIFLKFVQSVIPTIQYDFTQNITL